MGQYFASIINQWFYVIFVTNMLIPNRWGEIFALYNN